MWKKNCLSQVSRELQVTKEKLVLFNHKSQIATLQSTGGEQFEWKVGDKAIHKKWGTGIVVSVRGEGDDTELDIAFPDKGIKRLLANLHQLKKVK